MGVTHNPNAGRPAKKTTRKKRSTRKPQATTEQTVGRPGNRTAKANRPSRGAGRAGGRPRRNAKSISEFREILGVLNRDPDKRYRWIKSTKNFDKRIFDAKLAGWEFVDASQEKDLILGEYAVGKTDKEGSFYRVPAGRRMEGEYLYLMWMPEEYAQEVDDWKAAKIDETETDLFRERDSDDNEHGQYADDKDLELWEEDRYAPEST